jgi:hypothetical protein
MPAGPNTQQHVSKISYSFYSIYSEAKLDGTQITYDVCTETITCDALWGNACAAWAPLGKLFYVPRCCVCCLHVGSIRNHNHYAIVRWSDLFAMTSW